MSVYTYPQSQVIDKVTFKKTEQGAVRAYLHANPKVGAEELQKIVETLHADGFVCTPFSEQGYHTLEVRKLKNEPDFRHVLENKGWINGPSTYAMADEKLSLKDKLGKRTLQLSGLTYLIGDWGFWTYNRKEADSLGMAGAFSYFLGTLALVFYGRNDQSDLQVLDKAKELEHFLASENIKPSEGSALHHVVQEKPKSIFQSFHEFGKRYPSEMFNSVTALAGVFVAASSIKKLKDPTVLGKHRLSAKMDIGLGTATAISGTLATVVKEKKPDPDDSPAQGWAWLKQQIQAHPLAIAGVGYTISTMCHAGSTIIDYKEAKRTGDKQKLDSVPRRGLFVGMALLSEFLLAISSKGHGHGVTSDNSVNESVLQLAANLIAAHPYEQQEKLIDSMAQFLSKPEILALKNDATKQLLTNHVELMRKNPWAQVAPAAEKAPEQAQPMTPVATEQKPVA